MSQDRVKLPKEVAEAIDREKSMGVVALMAQLAHFKDFIQTSDDMRTIYRYYYDNPYMIASALVNGYEVEMTPEDKVREYYRSLKTDDMNDWKRAQRIGIKTTLDHLGIKISGVNAE